MVMLGLYMHAYLHNNMYVTTFGKYSWCQEKTDFYKGVIKSLSVMEIKLMHKQWAPATLSFPLVPGNQPGQLIHIIIPTYRRIYIIYQGSP